MKGVLQNYRNGVRCAFLEALWKRGLAFLTLGSHFTKGRIFFFTNCYGILPAFTYRDQFALKCAELAVPTITAKVPVKRKTEQSLFGALDLQFLNAQF